MFTLIFHIMARVILNINVTFVLLLNYYRVGYYEKVIFVMCFNAHYGGLSAIPS